MLPCGVQESDTQLTGLIPAHRGSDKQRPAGGVDQGDKQQLQQLTDTMQQQISALARAVEELKEVRCWGSQMLGQVHAHLRLRHGVTAGLMVARLRCTDTCTGVAPAVPNTGGLYICDCSSWVCSQPAGR